MADDELLNPDEIEALLNAAQNAPSGGSPFSQTSPDELAGQVESDLAAALAPTIGEAGNAADALPFQFDEFGMGGSGDPNASQLDALRDVELDLRIELGRTQLLIEDVLKLKDGSVVSLDKLAGDPVDIIVNGRLIGRGEVLVLNDNFCVRVAEILAPDF